MGHVVEGHGGGVEAAVEAGPPVGRRLRHQPVPHRLPVAAPAVTRGGGGGRGKEGRGRGGGGGAAGVCTRGAGTCSSPGLSVSLLRHGLTCSCSPAKPNRLLYPSCFVQPSPQSPSSMSQIASIPLPALSRPSNVFRPSLPPSRPRMLPRPSLPTPRHTCTPAVLQHAVARLPHARLRRRQLPPHPPAPPPASPPHG